MDANGLLRRESLISLSLEAKCLEDAPYLEIVGPLEISLLPGDRLNLLMPDLHALRSIREIICGRDLNWLGTIGFAGIAGSAAVTSHWFCSRFMRELSSTALPADRTTRELLHGLSAPSGYWNSPVSLAGNVDEILDELDLVKHADHQLGRLPFQERQRLVAASLLLTRPGLVLIDGTEPVSSLNRPFVHKALLQLMDAGSALLVLGAPTATSWEFLNCLTLRVPSRRIPIDLHAGFPVDQDARITPLGTDHRAPDIALFSSGRTPSSHCNRA